MTVYREVFSRVYKDQLGQEYLAQPIWLPPAAGGLGFPILESEIPDYGWKYIRHIYDVLEISDPLDRAIAIYGLKTLNNPSKKGISTWEKSLEVFQKVTKSDSTSYVFLQYEGDLTNCQIDCNTIYDDRFVKDLLSFVGVNVPMDPYDPSKYDFDSLKNEASLINFIKVDDLLGEIERVNNFHEFLTKKKVREQRTLEKFLKDSRRYWNKHGITVNHRNGGVVKGDCPKFKSWVKLEKDLLFNLNGWIYMGDTTHSVFTSLPTLKVDFSKGRNKNRKVLDAISIADFVDIVNASLKGEEMD
jgi:hypothetical protein